MTLDTIVRRVNYQGDDNTTCFPFPFKVWGEEQVVVYCSDPATPWTETNVTQQTTITLNVDNYGGAVIFKNPPASGINLAIVREGSFLQEDEYLSGSRFNAHEIEDRFDEDAAERQELLDATARSIKVPNSSTQTPEEVYEELLSGAAFVNSAITSLTELYNQALYYYNLTMGYLGDVNYTQAKETSFTIDQTHIVNYEGEWIHTFNDGFKYYPTTHQLLVTVDGLALTPGTHFKEIGDYGTESNQIRFTTDLYQGQQVYIKALFLGTEAFNVKLQEMDDKIDAANNELNSLIEKTTNEFQAIIDGLDEEIAQTESLIKDALQIVGTAENWETFQDAINELNSIYSTFTKNELPTQGYTELPYSTYGNACITLPTGVCYFKGTNTLHIAIDGLILSPKYFEEIGGSTGANVVKTISNLCLYQGQELYAWTESFWGREGWEPEAYQSDITTRLYATSMSGCIYYSDDLGRCWRSSAAGLEDDANGEDSAGQLPECLQGQRIVATSDTLWAFTAPQEAEDNTTTERTLVCSTDGGLTWDCYIKNGSDGDSNSNGWQSSYGDPYAFAATDNALVLATCQGLFCCSTGGTWDSISSLGSNPPSTYCWGLIEAASDGNGFLAIDLANPRQIVYFDSDNITCSTNNISDVKAIAGNGQYRVLADACGQVEYAANCPSFNYWQTGAQIPQGSSGSGVTCIYVAREGFVALGSGTACTASPRDAWKCSEGFSGTLCAGLHLPDHGLYLAIGGDSSHAYALWSWDGLNWNCGCGIPNNATLNNIWASEHLPFFTNEPVTELEPMSPAAGLEEEVPPEDENQEENGEGGNTGDGENNKDQEEDSNEEGGSQEEGQTGSGIATALQAFAAFEQAASEPASENDHCYLWGPISPTYQLKSDLCFNSSSIPVRITIDQTMPSETGSSHGNGATIAIYKSDTYQRLTREDLNIEDDSDAKSLATSEQSSPQVWCEFARYDACGPICANAELYTCFAAAGQGGNGEALTAPESYPTCWPAGYYAAAIYCVYGGCSLQSRIPKVNFYVSRKERYSSNAAGVEEDAAGAGGDASGAEPGDEAKGEKK